MNRQELGKRPRNFANVLCSQTLGWAPTLRIRPHAIMSAVPPVEILRRQPAPAVAPQALAWHDGMLWIGSRDLRRVYRVDSKSWTILEEIAAPGIPWAAVSVGHALWFTLGEGEEDDRYLHRFVPGTGFARDERIACPDFTGSYLSFDGSNLYLSQWYQHRILKLDDKGNILESIEVQEEICGHTCVDGKLYVLRGTEQDGEQWRISRLDLQNGRGAIEDLATIPFQSRSLTFDGEQFWSNHRAADTTIAFTLPH